MPETISLLLVGAVFAVVVLFYTAVRIVTGKSAFEQDSSPKFKDL